MTKSNEEPPENADDFAAAVIKLYDHAVKGKGDPEPIAGNQSREVGEVAFGLAFLRQLLDEYAKRPHVLADIPESGVASAYGILDHLTTGNNHPIARHIKGIRSGRFRPGHAPANSVERARQAVIVGLVRAIQSFSGIIQSEAIRKAVEAAQIGGVALKEAQIRNLDNRFRTEGNSLPDIFESTFLRGGASSIDRMLALGTHHISALWSVPKLPVS